MSSAGEDELTVFAAASLTEAFTEIGAAYEDANDGTTVSFNFSGSQVLATQIIEGGPADVFAAADVEQMDRAAGEGRIEGEASIFALNRLVVIVPADNPANIESAEDLARPGVKLVLAAAEVPAGRYARQLIDHLPAGAGFAERVEDNVVSNESNVRQVVAKVQLGEADAAIVYATDVTADVAEEVAVIEVPDESNVMARYVIAVVEGASDEAQEFVAFVLSAEGARILESHGFTTPER